MRRHSAGSARRRGLDAWSDGLHGQRVDGRRRCLSTAAASPSIAQLHSSRRPAAPHVRSYFPEALYINPEILTDAQRQRQTSPSPSPTPSPRGAWPCLPPRSPARSAARTSSLKVFQDFFVDLDLPVTLTQGDRVSIPIAVYNYSGKSGEVSLKLQPDDWFSLDNDTPEKTVSVESGRVGGSQFTLNANRIGKFKLTLSAHMEGAAIARRHRRSRDRGHPQRPRAETSSSTAASKAHAQHDLHFPAELHSRRQQHPRPPLSRSAQPDHRRHGQHSQHARRLLRADFLQHLSQRAGARLHEAHQEADAGGLTPRPKATSPTATSGCLPSKFRAAASPGSARRPPTRSLPPTA